MIASMQLNRITLITAFILLINQQILFCVAQQTDVKTAEQSVTTKLLHTSPQLAANGFSDALSHTRDGPPELSKATPIACYECNSFVDPDCADKPQNFVKNCTNSWEGSAIIGCRKIDQWVDYDGGEGLHKHHRVIRQCAADGDISKPCYYRAGFGGRINACFCDSNLCNSGHFLNAINFQFMFIMLFSLHLIYRFS